MANSFASLSMALTIGSLVLGLIGVVGGGIWGWVVMNKAENEARTEAAKCAKEYVEKWLATEAPAIIRLRLEKLIDPNAARNGAATADAYGEGAG